MNIVTKFTKDRFNDVMNILVAHSFPVSSFVSSPDVLANGKSNCTRCGHMVDTAQNKGETQELYGHITVEEEDVQAIFIELVKNGFTSVFLFPSTEEMFKELRVQCQSCLDNLNEEDRSITSDIVTSPRKRRRIESHHRNIDDNVVVYDDNSSSLSTGTCLINNVKEIKFEGNDIVDVFNETPSTTGSIEGSSASNTPQGGTNRGDYNMMCEENPEYNWVKCRLCSRVLRTKQFDPSRMRTLKNSHARNHVYKPQFSCNLCSYGCRFSGGIQLHVSREHPGETNAFTDRSRFDWFRDQIDQMVVCCFGPENLPRKKYTTKRNRLAQHLGVAYEEQQEDDLLEQDLVENGLIEAMKVEGHLR